LDVAPGYGIARVPVAVPFSSRSLADVDLTGEYRVTVLALHREGNVTLHPHASEMLHLGDELIVAGLDEDLEKLPGTGALPPS
jgi:K+/H+ antiporter YhaU regulatory subunit KhtT